MDGKVRGEGDELQLRTVWEEQGRRRTAAEDRLERERLSGYVVMLRKRRGHHEDILKAKVEEGVEGEAGRGGGRLHLRTVLRGSNWLSSSVTGQTRTPQRHPGRNRMGRMGQRERKGRCRAAAEGQAS